MTNEGDGNWWNYRHRLNLFFLFFFLDQNFEVALAYVKELYKDDPFIKKEDYVWIEHIRSNISKCCERIIYDAQNMCHRNGSAKRWGCSLLTLATHGCASELYHSQDESISRRTLPDRNRYLIFLWQLICCHFFFFFFGNVHVTEMENY